MTGTNTESLTRRTDMYNRWRGPARKGLAALAVAALTVAAGTNPPARADEPKTPAPTGVTLKVFPLKREYFGVNTVEVLFEYVVREARPDGTAEVRMRNVDTGEDKIKRFPIALEHGLHQAWARWGGTGPDTSSENAEIELLLFGDDRQDGLPDGLYVPQVILKDADGKVLAEHQASANEVQQLAVAGKALRVISDESIDRKVKQMTAWIEELRGLAEKARAAGADPYRPLTFIAAMRETLRQLPERRSIKEYELILYNYAYIENHVAETRLALERMIENPRLAPPGGPLPCPAERTTVKDGSYWAGDKPIFMGGLCMFTIWMKDLPVIRELGYNVIHVFCGGGDSVFPTPDSEPRELRLGDLAGPPENNYPVRKLLDECQELGLKVDLGLNPNLPWWFFEKHPDARVRGQSVGLHINYDIEHPEALKFIERFYDEAMKQIAGHPALNTIWLVNEPMYWNASERHAAVFREHLKAKYVTVEALNKAWGTKLKSFDAIKGLPPARQAPPVIPPTADGLLISPAQVGRAWDEPEKGGLAGAGDVLDILAESRDDAKAAASGAAATSGAAAAAAEPAGPIVQLGVNWGADGVMNVDLWNFTMGRLTRHFEWLTTLVRRHDPTVRTAFKLNNLQMGWYVPVGNVDYEAVTDLTEIAGMDSGTFPGAKPYYDWLRSLDPEKPVVNLEFKGGQYRTQLDFWKGTLSFGLAGIDWWAWHPKTLFANAMAYTISLHQGALAVQDIQRLWPQVRAFHTFPRSPFVVVYPDPIRPRCWNYFTKGHDSTVHALKNLGYAVDYATEKRIAGGRLDEYRYRIAVLPAADYIRDETLSRIESFVRGGGIALVIGQPPAHDELGRPRDIAWLEPPPGAPRAIEGIEGSAVFPCGKGKVWRIPAPKEAVGWNRVELVPALREVAARELPPQPVKIVSGHLPIRRFDRAKGFVELPLKPIDGAAEWPSPFENRTISWTNAAGEAVLLTSLFSEDQLHGYRLEATFSVPVIGGTDLITGEPIDPRKIDIDPWGVRLIEWKLGEK